MTILGLDPGYGIVGYGLIKKTDREISVLDYGVIKTPKEESMSVRLSIIFESLKSIIEKFKPNEIAIEEIFFFKNQKTVIPVAQARGVMVLCANMFCSNIFEYTPLQIKQALTGYGNAEKQQIQFMVKALLKLDKIPKPDDAADALAIAICHSQHNSGLNTNRV